MSDEDLVLDCDPLADEGVTLDLAVGADRGILLDLDEAPDAGVVTDPAAVQVNEAMHGHVSSDPDVRGDPDEVGRIRSLVRRRSHWCGLRWKERRGPLGPECSGSPPPEAGPRATPSPRR